MSKTAVKAIPEGMHTLTPHLICAGASDAIEFYKKAFSAVELTRLATHNGKLIHAVIRIGDSALMLVDEAFLRLLLRVPCAESALRELPRRHSMAGLHCWKRPRAPTPAPLGPRSW